MNNFLLRNRLCFPVKGYNRSVVYDLVRNDYHLISNQAQDVINTENVILFETLNGDLVDDFSREILINEEILFEVKDFEDGKSFPMPNLSYQSPFHITELILSLKINIKKISQFEGVAIQNVSLISEYFDFEEVIFFLKQLNNIVEPQSIYLYIKNSGTYDYEEVKKLTEIPQLLKLYLFNSEIDIPKNHQNSVLEISNIGMNFSDFASYCHPEKLILNNELFFESLNYHSYYHKKIYINETGDVLHGLNASEVLSNIYDNHFSIWKLMDSTLYKEIGAIQKMDTTVCNICEFRYMCSDPRMPSKGSNSWYHLVECTYNPYISKWKGEEGYKSLSEIGVIINAISGLISLDEEKLTEYNKTLWINARL